ncbi:MAG: hypothetical protein Fur0037_11320 [Planctomycetota bacterium]
MRKPGEVARTPPVLLRSINTGSTTIEPKVLSPSGIDLRRLDVDAVRATRRLVERGFEAYLVGGCVRDLLLGRKPKDYDIATEARPQQVKRAFPRNCRIIGRRFKLAHLHFNHNSKILECSTFRRTPELDQDDDLLITRDNEFGTAEEDALRRDFTVNALFLDPIEDRILDFAQGLADIEDRVIRTIGDPKIRFREDPVRILRAAKFAGRLGFRIDQDTLSAMAAIAPDLTRAAPPRVLEEILRLLRSGHALDSFQLLRDIGALKSLVPLLAEFLASAPQPERVSFWRLLDALDQSVLDGNDQPNAVLLSILFYEPVRAAAAEAPERSPLSVAEELLGPLGQTLRLPRRDAGCLKRVCGLQHRFDQGPDSNRRRLQGLLHSVYFDEALRLFELRCRAGGIDDELLGEWREADGARGEDLEAIAFEHEPPSSETRGEAEAPPVPGRRKRRRRRRRKGARLAEETEWAPPPIGESAGPAGDRPRKGAPDGIALDDRAEPPPAEGARRPDSGGEERKDRKRRRRRGKKQKEQDSPAPAAESPPQGAPDRRKRRRNKGFGDRPSRDRAARERARDVGVVPRRQDRRGKVEVIEPARIDLSAFDAELDPKHVLTFGSIVEGGRKKKQRPARAARDGMDDYRPPPPPGQDLDPLPPPREPDEFGDW